MKVGIDTSKVYTDLTKAPGRLGEIVEIDHHTYGHGAWVLGQADEAIAAGEFCIITEADGGAILMNTTDSGSTPNLIGAPDAALAANEYGWFWVGKGRFEAEVDNGVAAGTQLTTIATDGEAGTGGDVIAGLTNVDAGVDGTRVTVNATGIMRTN